MSLINLHQAKRVRIMCDYGGEPVWDSDGVNRSVDDLPITEELRAELLAWQDLYDDYEAEVEGLDFDIEAFSRTGRELAGQVKAQLPDWTVIYFDEAAAENRSPDAPPESFIYEIKL